MVWICDEVTYPELGTGETNVSPVPPSFWMVSHEKIPGAVWCWGFFSSVDFASWCWLGTGPFTSHTPANVGWRMARYRRRSPLRLGSVPCSLSRHVSHYAARATNAAVRSRRCGIASPRRALRRGSISRAASLVTLRQAMSSAPFGADETTALQGGRARNALLAVANISNTESLPSASRGRIAIRASTIS